MSHVHPRQRSQGRLACSANDDEAVGSPTPFLRDYGRGGGAMPPAPGPGLQLSHGLHTQGLPAASLPATDQVTATASPTGAHTIHMQDHVPEWGSTGPGGRRSKSGGSIAHYRVASQGAVTPGWVTRIAKIEQQTGVTRHGPRPLSPVSKPRTCRTRFRTACQAFTLLLLLTAIVSVYWLWPRAVSVSVVEAAARFPLEDGQSERGTLLLDVALRISSDNYLPIGLSKISTQVLLDVPPQAGSEGMPMLVALQGELRSSTGSKQTASVGPGGVPLPARTDSFTVLQLRVDAVDLQGGGKDGMQQCVSSALAGGASACRLLVRLQGRPTVLAGLIPLPETSIQVPLELRA